MTTEMKDPIGRTPQEKLLCRAERLVKLLKIDVPPDTLTFADRTACKEFFLIKRSIYEIYDDELIKQAQFEVEVDPGLTDEIPRGVG